MLGNIVKEYFPMAVVSVFLIKIVGPKKCVFQRGLGGSSPKLLGSNVMGKCSPTNQSTCYTGEVVIEDGTRRVITPFICD